ncbi:unnamed protein product (mitochondrion) [Plasmodiophora brassicae]|uniref:Uncharacterized protein n=1 Tax=Plasmodiophora brassicae TaxID=37360 RepID=A0A0G4IKC3_PLABS|nr:hypothetical protein PBRA_004419 [Plasmodiophora brassicae]SPQ99956.1 unnamed protein product [Plasmodiophora brassicae]
MKAVWITFSTAACLLAMLSPVQVSGSIRTYSAWAQSCQMCQSPEVKCVQVPGSSPTSAQAIITVPADCNCPGCLRLPPSRMAGCDGAQKIIFSFSYSRPMVKAVNNEFLRPGDKEHLKNVQAIGFRNIFKLHDGAISLWSDLFPWITWLYGDNDVVVQGHKTLATERHIREAEGALDAARGDMTGKLRDDIAQLERDAELANEEADGHRAARVEKQRMLRDKIADLSAQREPAIQRRHREIQAIVEEADANAAENRRLHEKRVAEWQHIIKIKQDEFARLEQRFTTDLNATIASLKVRVDDLTANMDALVEKRIHESLRVVECRRTLSLLEASIKEKQGNVDKTRAKWSTIPWGIAAGLLAGAAAGRTSLKAPDIVVKATPAPTAAPFAKGAALAAITAIGVNAYADRLSAKARAEISRVKNAAAARPARTRASGRMTLLYLMLGLTGALAIAVVVGAVMHKKLTSVPTMSDAVPIRILEL